MPDDNQPREDATQPIADPALVEDAEVAAAEAAEAEALAVAAQARARAIRLRQQAESAAMARTRQRDSAESSVDSEEADESTINAEVTGAASADSPDADEAAERPAGTESPRRRLTKPRPATVISGAAVALVCALLGASVLIAVQHHGAVQRRQSAAAFIAAAKQGVINMTSLNFQNVEEDIQRVLDNSTGEFRDDFERQAADFTEVTKQAHVVSEGTVNLAAIESMERDSAVVLVAATSRVTNSAGAKAEPRTWRLRVTVSRDGDQLKMSKLVYVP